MKIISAAVKHLMRVIHSWWKNPETRSELPSKLNFLRNLTRWNILAASLLTEAYDMRILEVSVLAVISKDISSVQVFESITSAPSQDIITKLS